MPRLKGGALAFETAVSPYNLALIETPPLAASKV
jgi:hypothetical protein